MLDKRLADRAYVAGDDYTIADMAIYPWLLRLQRERDHLGRFANLGRWFDAVGKRPATTAAYAKGRAINTTPTVTEDSKAVLLGQGAETLAA